MERKIQKLKFVARCRGRLRDFWPAAGDTMQKNPQRDGRARQIEEQLHHVGPDHRFHPTLERIDDRQRDDDEDRKAFRRAQHHTNDQRNGRDAHAFGQRARDKERRRRHGPHIFPEAFLNQFVGRIKLAAKIARQEKQHNQHAAKQVPED